MEGLPVSLAAPWWRRSVVVAIAALLLTVLLPLPAVHAEAPPAVRDAVLTDLPVASGGLAPAGRPAATDTASVLSAPVTAPLAFSLLGVSGRAPASVALRTQGPDGRWSDWESVEPVTVEDGPDPDLPEAAAARRPVGAWVGQPHWVGHAVAVQLLVSDGDLADLEVAVIDSLGLSETRLERVARHLRAAPTPAPAEALTSGRIVSRAEWGANESLNRRAPRYARVRFGVLHHTATSNTYTREQAPGVVRAIHRYHVERNGWADIGYNLLVDRFGTVYEGRAGGVDRGVIGAHAANHNTGSFGVSFIGNTEQAPAPAAALASIRRITAWKFAVHGLDARPEARTTHNGRVLPLLVGHRDVGSTACPGRHLRGWLPTLRSHIASDVTNTASGWTPVVGDWWGTGSTSLGWFRDGWWRLHASSAGPGLVRVFAFGEAGDHPVVGDWTGDGITTVGVVRDGRWLLRFTNEPGSPDADFLYGRGAIDHPMAGDWNGDGFDTPAIVRDGEWHLRNSLSGGPADRTFVYGRVLRGDVPLVGDWLGTGVDYPGIVRDGEWHLRYSHRGGPADQVFTYGRVTRGDRPLIGTWEGADGLGVGVNRAGVWYLRMRLSGGPADRILLRW